MIAQLDIVRLQPLEKANYTSDLLNASGVFSSHASLDAYLVYLGLRSLLFPSNSLIAADGRSASVPSFSASMKVKGIRHSASSVSLKSILS